ncbi:PREDICTED: branchpoint-bridging protein-like [Camelina sativa]|uniref:Branchpoint-bridging protein-like n=1 Tax=Camelina sativa TaxID=90675 RepID=A0ABM1QGB1_CAMSA|nr:PREDICTED: branchpoint-bridging protein-like [Camelina sativa]
MVQHRQSRNDNNNNNNNNNHNNNRNPNRSSSSQQRPNYGNWSNNSFSPNNTRSKPYLGKCQICNTQGHSARRCPQLNSFQSSPQRNTSPFTPWQPRAYMAVLDSGATHHITSDLNSLSLHQPYNGGDDLVIADGSTMPISHIGEGSQYGGSITPRSDV